VTYDGKELTAEGSSPVMVYHFIQGTTTWRYVALSKTFTFLGYPCDPEIIAPSDFGVSNDVPKDSLTFRLPITNNLAETFIGGTPSTITTVNVYRTHYDDTDYIVYWKGRVASSAISGNFVELVCDSIFSSLRRLGIRPQYQRMCRHALYGRGCNVVQASYAYTGHISTVSGVNVTVTEAAFIPKLTGGILKAANGTMSMILRHSGTNIMLMRPLPTLAVGQEITMYIGCNHSISDCKNVFNNLGNYGGWPGIPGINPMNGSTPIV